MTVKELLRFCSISLVPWLILHSRSLSRYIEFQTWILSQARARERRDEEVVEKGVELTQSPVSPETRGWEKERKLREGTAAFGWRTFWHPSIAREIPFVRRPFCISRFASTLLREENRRGRAFFAPRWRVFLSNGVASPFLSFARPVSKDRIHVSLDGNSEAGWKE